MPPKYLVTTTQTSVSPAPFIVSRTGLLFFQHLKYGYARSALGFCIIGISRCTARPQDIGIAVMPRLAVLAPDLIDMCRRLFLVGDGDERSDEAGLLFLKLADRAFFYRSVAVRHIILRLLCVNTKTVG